MAEKKKVGSQDSNVKEKKVSKPVAEKEEPVAVFTTDTNNAKKNTNLEKSKLVIKIILWIFGIALIGLALFSKQLFGSNSLVGKIMGDSNGGVKSIINGTKKVVPLILRSIVTIIISLMVSHVLRAAVRLGVKHGKRGKTICTIIDSMIKYISAIVIILLVLGVWGVNTTTLVASLGILSLIIGLGCQSLINDVISGIFIIFENEFEVGDIIVIDGFRGTVAEIGIRTTKIIDAGGDIKVINNSNIQSIINMTDELSLAVCDVDIEYDESIERVENIISDNLKGIKTRIPGIVEGPYYKGVAALAASGVTIRLVAKCNEEDRFQVVRDMNREIKLVFDQNNVGIPFPQIVVNQPVKKINKTTKLDSKKAKDFVDKQKQLSKNIKEDDNEN